MRMKLGDGNYRHVPQSDSMTPPEDWRAQLFEESGRDREAEADRPRRRRKTRQRVPSQDRHAAAVARPR